MASPDAPGAPAAPVAYVLGTFPQASQTFIAREVRGLLALGVPLTIYALRRQSPDALEQEDRSWFPRVKFAPRAPMPASIGALLWWLQHDPGRLSRAFRAVVLLPHQPSYLRLRAIVLVMRAAWIARDIARSGGCRQVHAHFALAQTEVAMAIAELLGCPFSFTAHARDIYATPNALPEKMRAARVVVTCTAYNADYLQGLCPELPAGHVRLVHHGVVLPVGDQPLPTPNVPLFIAAGRLIEKKGFDDLIAACALLRDRGLRFRCRIVGDGPMRGQLNTTIQEGKLEGLVTLLDWVPAEELLKSMAQSAALVMPSRISERGDRDGIPNVVLEAMAAGRPVVATRVSGIPEAVQDGVTGILTPPGDPCALAGALERILADPESAGRMGAAGRRFAEEEFALDRSSARLAAIFTQPDNQITR